MGQGGEERVGQGRLDRATGEVPKQRRAQGAGVLVEEADEASLGAEESFGALDEGFE